MACGTPFCQSGKVLKIDDPVGAISVHGICGAIGTILTGLLAVDGGACSTEVASLSWARRWWAWRLRSLGWR